MHRFAPNVFFAITLFPFHAIAQDEQISCNEGAVESTIEVGDIINCLISPVADTDIFRFEGTAGDWLMLTLTDRTGGSPAPVAEIFDPGGTPIDTLVNQDSGDRMILELETSGTYSVLVRESADNQTVNYNLALQSVFPAPFETQDLAIDTEMNQSIDVVADSDVVQFEGEANSTIVLTLTDRTGGSPVTVADVYDPDRELVQEALYAQDTGEAWQVELSKTGTYTIVLRESGDNQTAAYALALQRLFPEPETAECVEYGSVAEASITPVADSDVYVFRGKAGTQIILTLADLTGGSPTPVAEVYDPDQALVHTLLNQDGSDPWQVTLTKSGFYTVLVRESGFNGTAAYNLGLQCLFPSSDACPSCEAVAAEKASWGHVKSMFR